MDLLIIEYLNTHSTNLQPKTALEIALVITKPVNEIWERCIFLAQKRKIKESGMGTNIDSCRYYI